MKQHIKEARGRLAKIVTHGGRAHRDDFLCACLALHLFPDAALMRLNGEIFTSFLKSNKIIIFDVGGQYCPDKLNFDHHQPGMRDDCCSFTLFMRWLGFEREGYEVWPWMEFTDIIDCQGPTRAAAWLGTTAGVLFRSSSPIERCLLQMFSDFKTYCPERCKKEKKEEPPLIAIMRQIGKEFWSELNKVEELAKMNLDQYTHSTTSGQDVFLMPKSVVNLSPKDINTAFHLQRKKSPGIVVLGNLRNVGWMMTRTRDDADVDFRDLNTLEVDTPFKIHFVHGNGYCAAVETDNPLALIEKLTQQK